MAQPENGLEKWELRKLRELGVNSWKNAADAKALMKKAMQEKAKKREAEQASGFSAVDSKAAKTEDKKTAEVVKVADTKVEVLPSTQSVDVSAPTINVHMPAPGVTISGQAFAFYPALLGVFNWIQAAVIGAAIYAALSSRLNDALAMGMLSP